jgi:hypothetical protein
VDRSTGGQKKYRWTEVAADRSTGGQKCRRTKVPADRSAGGQKYRRTKVQADRSAGGQKCRRTEVPATLHKELIVFRDIDNEIFSAEIKTSIVAFPWKRVYCLPDCSQPQIYLKTQKNKTFMLFHC